MRRYTVRSLVSKSSAAFRTSSRADPGPPLRASTRAAGGMSRCLMRQILPPAADLVNTLPNRYPQRQCDGVPCVGALRPVLVRATARCPQGSRLSRPTAASHPALVDTERLRARDPAGIRVGGCPGTQRNPPAHVGRGARRPDRRTPQLEARRTGTGCGTGRSSARTSSAAIRRRSSRAY
jgi:hypothetical protein